MATGLSNKEELVAQQLAEAAKNKDAWGSFIYNFRDYGADPKGTSDSSAALSKVIAAIGTDEATICFPSGKYKISSNLTIPSNITLWFLRGGNLSPDSGKTITVNGRVDAAPTQQIFDITKGGVIAGAFSDEYFPNWFGAKGNNSTICDAAIAACVTLAGYLGCVVFPVGVFKLTVAADLRSRRVRGQGVGITILNQYTASEPVAIVGEVYQVLTDMTIQHNNRAAVFAETVPNGVGLDIQRMGYGSELRRLEIKHNTSGMYSKESRTAGKGNYVFSSNIQDITIGSFNHSAIYFQGSSTGNDISNIYIKNWDDESIQSRLYSPWGAYFKTVADNNISQFNVEHGLYGTALEIIEAPGFVIDSLHFEGAYPSGPGLSTLVKSSFHSSVLIRGLSFSYSTISSVNVSTFTVFQLADDTTIDVKGADIHDITISGTVTRRRLVAGGTLLTGANLNIDGLKMTTSIFSSPDSIDVSYPDTMPIVTTTVKQPYDDRGKIVFNNHTLWIDSAEQLRAKAGYPTSDTDGVIVANQTSKVGKEIYNGDGSTPTRNIAHGFGVTPTSWYVQAASTAAGVAGVKNVSADDTFLYVFLNIAPASGTNNVRLNWAVFK